MRCLLENLTIDFEIEDCERILQIIESDFTRICEIYVEIISITENKTSNWHGDISSSFASKMQEFQLQLDDEATRMDAAMTKMRGCLQKAKEIESLAF
jgi:hypothetical protein